MTAIPQDRLPAGLPWGAPSVVSLWEKNNTNGFEATGAALSIAPACNGFGTIRVAVRKEEASASSFLTDERIRQEKAGRQRAAHIPNGVYLTGFFSNDPTQEFGDDVFAFPSEHRLVPKTGAVCDFTDIREACLAQDGKKRVDGKIVINI